MEQDRDVNEAEHGVSRRTAIKRLAVGAGVVWVAPVVMSVESMASAASNPNGCPTAFICANPTDTSCGAAGAGCFCIGTVDAGNFCAGDFACAGATACTTSADCPPGWVCQSPTSGCCGQVCAPPCGTAPALVGATSGAKTNRG